MHLAELKLRACSDSLGEGCVAHDGAESLSGADEHEDTCEQAMWSMQGSI